MTQTLYAHMNKHKKEKNDVGLILINERISHTNCICDHFERRKNATEKKEENITSKVHSNSVWVVEIYMILVFLPFLLCIS
jgi:hypothetical protein